MQSKIPFQNVIKRDGRVVPFDKSRIVNAVKKAMEAAKEGDLEKDPEKVGERTVKGLIKKYPPTHSPHIEEIQDIVEESLILMDFPKTAKAYILYRDWRARLRKRNIFEKRVNLKPYEYPELVEYVDAIRHSYWLHTEFNFSSDIQDFRSKIAKHEQNAIKNSTLAIAQVEVSVKLFWGDLYKKLPKPEIGAVGQTFAESEVRHMDAYAHLLKILGLDEEFEKVKNIPALSERILYLDKAKQYALNNENREFAKTLLLFSIFVEHVSLFSQFLIIMSFNKYRNLFKGVSNAVEATSKEEQIHGLFGIDVINIIKEENPEWFDKAYEESVINFCRQAYLTEEKLVDWIFEEGELDFLPAKTVKEFIKNRLNNDLEAVGIPKPFAVDEKLLEQTEWFNDEVIGTKHTDFFFKRSINYTKRKTSITADDIF